MRPASIKRREFITLIGGAAVWPLASHAQQGERMRRIGWMDSFHEDDPNAQARARHFVKSWTSWDGRSVEIS